MQAACNPDSKQVYELALFTFSVATVHFVLEAFWFQTMTKKMFFQSGGPVLDAATAAWMAVGWVRNWYF